MKARLSLSGKVSNSQMKVLREFCDQRFRDDAQDHTRRLLKIACIALNERYGFGVERCGGFLEAVTKISEEHMTDEVFWTHADKRLEQMGLPFLPEDYDKIESQQRQLTN